MADTNPFADIYATPDEPEAAPANDNGGFGENFFADIYNEPEPTDPFQEFGRSAMRSLAPAAASLIATGYGATAGATLGAFGGPIGAFAGGIAGGLIGGFGGAAAVQATQDFVLDALPDDWVESIGQSDEQIARGQKEQPVASFLGALLPYTIAMKPGGFGYKVPANATTFQRILANPATGSVFGGAVNGGMELGMEVGSGEAPDWTKIGISTAFGMVFNKPTKIGQSLTGAGDRAAKRMGFRGMTEAPVVAAQPEPTVAQAADAKVMGPGVTEEVFMGTQEQSPETAQAAQEQVRTETSLIRPQVNAPDVRRTARDLEPELFNDYDSLSATRDDLRARLSALGNPTDETMSPIAEQRAALQTRLDTLTTSQAGYGGGAAARRIRAQIRDMDARLADMEGRRTAFSSGTLADDAEMAALRRQIMQTDLAMRDLAPQVSAAMRRAADYAGGEVIEPGVAAPVADNGPVPTEEVIGARPVAEPEIPMAQQLAAIAEDVTRAMLAAGRPEIEAKAWAQVEASRYRARAAGLGNSLTPQALYESEGPVIRGRPEPANKEGALAQSKRDRAAGYLDEMSGIRRLMTLTKNADASTVVHESGHQWIEELLRDAVHEAATPTLKADAAAARKWLGMKDDQASPTTRQHEKWARGTEQFFREGVAPNASLARVFSQFRNWLIELYQTIKGLGVPINDDFRGVMDRLLEAEPQRTVIGDHAEPEAGGIARTHETDADTIEPQDAEPALDRVIAERERAVAELPPEIANEIAAVEAQLAAAAGSGVEPAGEGGDAGGGVQPVGDTGAATGPIPSGGPGGSEPSPLGGSSPAPGPQSAGLGGGAGAASGGSSADAGLRSQRPGAADASRANPLAPSATTLFGPDDSPFVDKAGNIRLDTLTNSEDVRQAIRDAAARNLDFIGDRGGAVTQGQLMDLAIAAGMEGAESIVQQRVKGQAFNASEIATLRVAIIQSATEVNTAMKKVSASGSDEDALALAQLIARHDAIQGTVSQAAAEAGRALGAFRDIKARVAALGVDQAIREATGRTLFQMKEMAALGAKLDSPAKLSRFLEFSKRADFFRMIQEYWINALVSGPRTHLTNVVSNTILAVQTAGPETAMAALIGSLRARTGRQGERVMIGEVGEQFRRAGSSLPVSLKAAADALKAGKGVELPSGEDPSLALQIDADIAEAPKLDRDATYQTASGAAFGVVRGVLDAAVAIGKLVQTGGDKSAPAVGFQYSLLGRIPDVQVRGTTVLPLGNMTRTSTRFLAAEDSFFRAANFSMEIGREAYRVAVSEGLTGEQRNARIADLYQNPTQVMLDRASDIAAERTFTSRRSEFVKQFSKLASVPIVGVPIVRFIAPFIQTPSNIIEQTALHRTPLGFLSPEIRADLLGKNGNVAQDTAQAKMIVGTAYAIGFGALTGMNLLNGHGPADDNERALWRLTGNQANSIRIGDIWYDIRSLGPVGMLASISADLYDVRAAAEEGGLSGATNQVISAFIQNILNASFMTGPADLIQATTDPERYGQGYIDKFLSSFVPAALAQPAQAIDPYARQARDTIETIKRRIPFVSQSLQPRIDIWGEKVPASTAFGPAGLSAIYTSRMSQDPVNLALLEGGYWPGAAPRQIRNVELTDEQYALFSQIAGRTAKQRLDQIVPSALFRSLDKSAKHDLIAETIRGSREAARGMIVARYPDIAVKAARIKMGYLDQ